jgi:hypothetical protein
MISRKQIFSYAIVGCVGLVMAACHFDLFETFNDPITDESKPIGGNSSVNTPAIAGAFDSGQALELMYGGYDSTTRRARWMPSSEERTRFRYTKTEGPLYTNVLMAERFEDAEGSHYVLLTRTLPARDECRECNPVLGGAVFSEVSNGWNLSRETRFIKVLNPADQWLCSKIKFSETRQGAKLHWRFINNGLAEEGDLLLVIEQNKLYPVFERITAGNNNADCDQVGGAGQACWAYQSKLKFQVGVNADFDDLEVQTSGTKLNENGNLIAFNERTIYVYQQGKYKPMSTTERPSRPRL